MTDTSYAYAAGFYQEQARQLGEALTRYGCHRNYCVAHAIPRTPFMPDCTCGLRDALHVAARKLEPQTDHQQPPVAAESTL